MQVHGDVGFICVMKAYCSGVSPDAPLAGWLAHRGQSNIMTIRLTYTTR